MGAFNYEAKVEVKLAKLVPSASCSSPKKRKRIASLAETSAESLNMES